MVAIAGGDVAKDMGKEQCYDGANGGEPPHLVVRQRTVCRNALEGDACAWDAPDKRGGEVEVCAWHSSAWFHRRLLWVIASLFVPVIVFVIVPVIVPDIASLFVLIIVFAFVSDIASLFVSVIVLVFIVAYGIVLWRV